MLGEESVLARADSSTEASLLYEGTSGDYVTVYARCLADRPGAEVDVVVTLPGYDSLTARCDGVVFREDIVTYRGRDFDVRVRAPEGVAWTALVTGRDRGERNG